MKTTSPTRPTSSSSPASSPTSAPVRPVLTLPSAEFRTVLLAAKKRGLTLSEYVMDVLDRAAVAK